jgi:hypothetical protein
MTAHNRAKTSRCCTRSFRVDETDPTWHEAVECGVAVESAFQLTSLAFLAVHGVFGVRIENL